MQAFVFIHSRNKARCTFLLQRGLAASTQRFCPRGKVYFIAGWRLAAWHAFEINGEGKCHPIWSLSLAIKPLTFKMQTSKTAQKASLTSGGGAGSAGSRAVSSGVSDERSPGVWPRIPPQTEPFLTKKLKVRFFSDGSKHQLTSPSVPWKRQLRSLEVPAACGAAEWSD